MIIGANDRDAVIKNIRRAVADGEFHVKVETGDPVLTPEQSRKIVSRYLNGRNTFRYRAKSFTARQMANAVTREINRNTEIVGIDNAKAVMGGAIITSNHFSPVENTAIRYLVKKLGKKRINIVSQGSNLAMPGIIGFLMNYADIIPITDSFQYIQKDFVSVLAELLENDEYILIYPEQEMWFNYRKPRPLKRGAYYYAAKLNVPVISCFVEIRDLDEMDNEEFHKVKYVVHVLNTLYPDKSKSIKENSTELCQKDYEQKKCAYEKSYGKILNYTFEKSDIAGWIGELS